MVVEGELVVVERSLSLKGKIPFGLGVVVTDSPKYFIIYSIFKILDLKFLMMTCDIDGERNICR